MYYEVFWPSGEKRRRRKLHQQLVSIKENDYLPPNRVCVIWEENGISIIEIQHFTLEEKSD